MEHSINHHQLPIGISDNCIGEAVDNYKGGLEQISCTINNCTTDVEKTEQATQAKNKLGNLLDLITAVNSAEINNGLRGIEVKGLAVLKFAKGLSEFNAIIELNSQQLSNDSQVTLVVGNDKLPVNLPAKTVFFELNIDNNTIIAKDNSNNILATGTLSLTSPADSPVGIEANNTRIEGLRVRSS